MKALNAFLNKPEIKQLIQDDNLTDVYCQAPTTIRNRLTSYLHILGVDPLEKFEKFIPDGAFYGNQDLTEVRVPGNIQEVLPDAFAWCPKLHTIQFDSGVKILRSCCLMGVPNLQTVYLPRTLTYIGQRVFAESGGNNVIDVYYQGTKEDFSKVQLREGWNHQVALRLHFKHFK